MIIQLLDADSYAIGAALSASDGPRYRAAIENLLMADSEGCHYVDAGHVVVDTLRRAAGWSERGSLALRRVAGRVATSGGVVGLAGDVLRARPGLSGVAIFGTSPRYYDVDLLTFSTSANVQPARVVFESQHDWIVFSSVCQVLRAQHAPKLGLRHDPVHGFGGNFHAQWSQTISAPTRPALGVVDSDRSGPSAPEGTTASNARDANADAPEGVRRLIVLLAREAENLLPERLVLEVYGSDPAVLNRAHSAIARGELGGERFEDLKSSVAKELLATCASWLQENGPRDHLRVLAGMGPELEEVGRVLFGFGLASKPAL